MGTLGGSVYSGLVGTLIQQADELGVLAALTVEQLAKGRRHAPR